MRVELNRLDAPSHAGEQRRDDDNQRLSPAGSPLLVFTKILFPALRRKAK